MIRVSDSCFFHAAPVLQPHGNVLRSVTSPRGIWGVYLGPNARNRLNGGGGDAGKKTTTGKAKATFLQNFFVLTWVWAAQDPHDSLLLVKYPLSNGLHYY